MKSNLFSIFDDPTYAQLAYNNREIYQTNEPFPHIVFDDFLPVGAADQLSCEYPSPDDSKKDFKFHSHEYGRRYFLEDVRQFTPGLKLFSQAVTSRSFLLFLETLTGLKSLLPDPYFMGGGAVITPHGGFLKMHVDFNWNQKLQAWRRINALFYLTPDWQEEWGGNLEFCDDDGQIPIKSVCPFFNRLVVFNTTSKTYHGQPTPISSLATRPRCVFSVYYYSTAPDEDGDALPYYTRYHGSAEKRNSEFDDSPYAQAIMADYLMTVNK